MPRLAAAVAAPLTGFFATAACGAGVFLATAVALLAAALFAVGVPVSPPAQPSAAMARTEAKIKIFRMVVD